MSNKLIGVDPNYDPEKVTQKFVDSVNSSISSGKLQILSPGIKFVEAQKFDQAVDNPIYEQGGSRTDVRMIILIDDAGNRHEVFIKSLPHKELEAELNGHKLCTELGIKHFIPAAIIDNGDDSFLLTEKVNVRPLSTISIRTFQEFETRTRKCVELLRRLHDKGFIHNDPKPKNFGFDDQENPFIYDFHDSEYHTDRPLTEYERRNELLNFLVELGVSIKMRSKWSKSGAVINLIDALLNDIERDYFNDKL